MEVRAEAERFLKARPLQRTIGRLEGRDSEWSPIYCRIAAFWVTTTPGSTSSAGTAPRGLIAR
jgi:hypothetical protein